METELRLVERRQIRSQIPLQALELYLVSLRSSRILESAALADRDGLPLAGLGTPRDVDFLALWGALSHEERNRYSSEMNDVSREGCCFTEKVSASGVDLWLVGLGPTATDPKEIVENIERILASTDWS